MQDNENKSTDADKQRPSRSFGSFLLFLFVLIILLVVVGGKTVTKPRTYTQDQYLFHLYSGRVISQVFRGSAEGTTKIVGTREAPERPQPEEFSVEFADAGAQEGLFREVKARDLVPIRSEALEAGVDSGLFEVQQVESVTAVETFVEPALTAERQPGEPVREERPAIERRRSQEFLLVEAVVPARGSIQNLPAALDDTELPARTGHQWFRVNLDQEADLGGLLARLTAGGAPVERHLFELSDEQGTSFRNSSSALSTMLLVLGPWVLIFLVFFFFMRQLRNQGGAGGVMSFGRSRAQMYSKENRTNVTFDDVAGAQEAKAEVRELVEFLKNPGRFQRIGGRIPRGVLLVGPPGCGKTLLAKAIAGEAEVPFFSISGSDFVEMFVGVGASRVRDLFKQARENSPCIIFLDEIDAVGRRRGSGMGGGHDEREQTLNAILVEMDGFSTDEGIIVVAATNRPDVLDPALLRPGRFDREVTIDLPDLEGRRAILDVHLKRVKHDQSVVLEDLARSTPGYSGADLAAIVNEAAIMAVLDKRDEVAMPDLEEARDKVRYGRKKRSAQVEEEDRRVTAYHEAGHAIVAQMLEHGDPPHKVTIVPRGRALGLTMMLPERDTPHTQRRRLQAQLAIAFGGRVAEQEFCGDISAGAMDDIRRATDLARAMVTELGMSDLIGPINYGDRAGSEFLGTELSRGKDHSESTAQEIDREVRRLIDEAYALAERVIRENREGMESVTQALLQFETINGEEIRKLLAGTALEDLRPEPPAEPESTPEARPEPPPRRSADGDLPGDLPGTPGLSPA